MQTPQRICNLFDSHLLPYQIISHPETKTSEESQKARTAAGYENIVGAKAIVMKMQRKQLGSDFDVFVLPSHKKINSKALKSQFKNVKSFRFATKEEMAEKTRGLVPGSMPPFAQPIFEKLNHLFIDTTLLENDIIGFNLASLTQSMIVQCGAYIQIANPTDIFFFSH